MNLLITGGRLLDPRNKRDGFFDLLIQGGKICGVDRKINVKKNVCKISAKECWILPGLIDAHVHLREPGGEESETVESGSHAAAAGGVTSLLAMANTRPPIDTPERVANVLRRYREKAIVKVYPVGAVTKGLNGKKLTDISKMVQAGCRALSDDGRGSMDSGLLRRALEQCMLFKIPLIDHCEDENLSAGGAMNEGALAHQLNLKGIPAESESVMVARNIFLAQLTGAPIHCAHISCKDSVELLRQAKEKGIPITCETCPHYFCLTENAVQKYGTLAKMKPPLRTLEDVQSVREGLKDGTIDIIATDHAPHSTKSKNKKFAVAPFGVIGLETSFALIYNELILKKILTPLKAVQKVTEFPAKIFDLPGGHLSVGSPADIAIFDPKKEWMVHPGNFVSKSSNSPFIGKKLKGKIVTTIVNGKIVHTI